MNCIINSSKLLEQPVTTNTTHMAVYMILVLLADASGEVSETRMALAERMHIPVVIIDAAIKQLCQYNLVATDNSVIRVLPNKSWKLAQQKTSVTRKIISKAQAAPSKLSLPDRIDAFVRLARQEFSSWRNKHKDDDLPKSEEDAFVRYWTEHNEGGSTFRREKEKVWQWQSRITTWFNNYKSRISGTGTRQAHSGKDELRRINEEMYKQELERIQQERQENWKLREKNKDGLTVYRQELKRAADGDEEMRRKYPDWQYLVTRNI